MKTTDSAPVHIGFFSIITILIIACISTFAVLSVFTAYSDYQLSQEFADNTTAYYKADSQARKMVEHLDNELYHIYLTTNTASAFYNEVYKFDFIKNAPDGILNFMLITDMDSPSISYMVSISDIENLYVTLHINYPHLGTECFSTITRWQVLTKNTQELTE